MSAPLHKHPTACILILSNKRALFKKILTSNSIKDSLQKFYHFSVVSSGRVFLSIGLCVPVAQSYPTLATPGTVAHQALLSKGFSRQEYWRGLLFPSPGDLPDPGIEPTFPALQVDSLLSEPPGKSPQFSDIIKIPLSLGRKLRNIDPPPQASICQSKSSVHPPALHPQQNELHIGSLLPCVVVGRVSGAHLVACVGGGWPGSRAVGGGAGGGVWLEEQLLCVCVGGGQR